MANGLETDLRNLIAERRLLVVVGSGVSIAATKNAPAASWPGLLELGAARCRELNPSLDDEWEKRLIGEITSGDLDDTLSAAEKISHKLQAPTGGEFSRWLRETVGALQLREPAVLEALGDLQVPLATTNYDDLLERITKLPAVTWRNQAKVFRFVRREEQAILHLHGHWDEPESVVLGIRSYEEVRQDAHAQALRQALAMTQRGQAATKAFWTAAGSAAPRRFESPWRSKSGVALRLPPQSKIFGASLELRRQHHRDLSAVMTGRREARMAGSSVPMRPTITAKSSPSATSLGVTRNWKTISLKVSMPIVAVV